MTDVMPSVLANAVMGKMYDVLTNGDATVPKSADNYFSWCTPGIPCDPADLEFLTQGLTGVVKENISKLKPDQINQLRAQNTARVYMQAEALSRIVDFVPEVTTINNNQLAQYTVSNNQGTLSDRYEFILRMSQVMHQDLDAKTQAKIARFRGLLQTTTQKTDLVTGDVVQVTGPSPLVLAYHAKMAAYNAAALQYNMARIDALAGNDPRAVQNFAINANILRNEVNAAMDDWISAGYKDDYEAIAAYIAQVQGRDMTLLKQQYQDDLAKAVLTGLSSGSNFYFTSLVPGNFAQSGGWSRFTFNSGHFGSYANSKFTSSGWSAAATGGFLGLFSAAGAARGSATKQECTDSVNLDTFNLSFEICEIPIARPFFKEAFIVSKTWRFDQSNPDAKGRLVSDGGSPPSKDSLIPAYPTAVVFVRNLVLGIDKSSRAGNFISESSSSAQGGGGSVNFGPFIVGGGGSHYSSKGYTQQNVTSSWDNQGLTIPGMQIVGFKCHILPKAPNPDQSIKSWA